MKILIVDDEELICHRIALIIKEASLEFQEILVAYDAFDAIDLIEKQKPAIVLTDISMPQKSGLDIAKYIFENKLLTIIILITGYSDFSYAQEGIRYNVFEYILKPVDPQFVTNTVKRAVSHWKSLKRQSDLLQTCSSYFYSHQDELVKKILEKALFNNIQILDSELKFIPFPFNNYCVAAFSSHESSLQQTQRIEYFITYTLERELSQYFSPGALLFSFCGMTYLLLSCTEKKEKNSEDFSQIIGQFASTFYQKYGILLSWGISSRADTPDSLYTLREQAELCITYQKQTDEPIMSFEELPGSFRKRMSIVTLMNHMMKALSICSKEQSFYYANEILILLKSCQEQDFSRNIQLISSNLLVFLKELPMDSGFEKLQEILLKSLHSDMRFPEYRKLFLSVLEQIYDSFHTGFQQKNDLLIEQVYKFVTNNYSKPIGLTDAAEYIMRNPSYTSRLIKQRTGKTFIQILTETRINASKTLLKNTTLKISEISEQVGYPSSRYFNQIFTAQMGMTPGDFRKIIQTLK